MIIITLSAGSVTDLQHYLLVLFFGETFSCLIRQHLLSSSCMQKYSDEMPQSAVLDKAKIFGICLHSLLSESLFTSTSFNSLNAV